MRLGRIAVLLALVLIAVFITGCAQEEKPKTTPTPVKETPKPTPTPAKKETPKTETPKPTPPPKTKTTPKVETKPKEQVVRCEACHTKAVNYAAHVTGGQKCANCHGSDPHKIHIGPGTINLQCSTCHGAPPNVKVPKPIEEGRTVCENCHAYPDPTKPSYGNLVNIHIPRGKYCTVCHGLDIASLHKAADTFVEAKT